VIEDEVAESRNIPDFADRNGVVAESRKIPDFAHRNGAVAESRKIPYFAHRNGVVPNPEMSRTSFTGTG
jgi:hypothetical protein